MWEVGGTLFLVVNGDLLQIFCFKNLAAVKTANVIDAIASGQYLGFVVITGSNHIDKSSPF